MPFEADTQQRGRTAGEGPAPDRKLGDEWEDWDGTPEGEIDEPGWHFIALATFVLVSIGALLALGIYLIGPRMEQWPPHVRRPGLRTPLRGTLTGPLWFLAGASGRAHGNGARPC